MIKKIIIIFTLLTLACVGVCAGEDLTISPSRLDTYFLYSGLGGVQNSEYKFIANRDIEKCEMIPADNAMCAIEHGHTVLVRYATTGAPYEGQVKIEAGDGFVTTSDITVRIYDIGAHVDAGPVYIGESLANSTGMNLFFATDEKDIIGVRWWVIIWLLILIGVLLLKEI